MIEKTASWLGLGFFWELLGLGLCCFGHFIPGEEVVHTDRPLGEVLCPRSQGYSGLHSRGWSRLDSRGAPGPRWPGLASPRCGHGRPTRL